MMLKPHRSAAALDRFFDFEAIDASSNENHSSAFKTSHTFSDTNPD